MTTQTKPITAEELFEKGDIGRCELVRGEIIHMSPSGAEHGEIAIEIGRQIANFVKANKLGKVFAAETGFTIARNPDTTRAPDVAFVRSERIRKLYRRGFFEGPPDLAVPTRIRRWSRRSTNGWAAGTVSVWVIDPPSKSIEVHGRASAIIRCVGDDELRDESVLPGFIIRPADLFDSD